VQVGEPAVLVGDIHGQYYDFVNLLKNAGDPKDVK
jgi:hypothetical protein